MIGVRDSRGFVYFGLVMWIGLHSSSMRGAVCTPPTQLQMSPATVEFANLEIGSSASKTVTVTNVSTYPVVITDVSLTPHAYFSAGAGDCLRTLDASESCSFQTTFQPSSPGAFTTEATVLTADRRPWRVTLSGAGVAPAQAVALTAPAGGESWTHSYSTASRHSHTISWNRGAGFPVQRTKLSYSTNGTTWTCIADSGDTDCADGCCNRNLTGTDLLESDATSFVWVMPTPAEAAAAGQTFPSQSARVNVQLDDGAGSLANAGSDNDFQVVPTSTYNVTTLILWNSERMAATYGSAERDALAAKLQQLAAHPSINGVIRDLRLPANVRAAYTKWDVGFNRNVGDANALAGAIRAYILEQFSVYSSAQYVILVGDDYQIPFHRMQDRTYLDESTYVLTGGPLNRDTSVGSSLLARYFLADNYYSETAPEVTTTGDTVYMNDLYLGRLVETPAQIGDVITRYLLQNGVTYLTSAGDRALVVGHDFLYDSTHDIKESYRAAGKTTDCLLDDEASATPIGCDQQGTNLEFTPADLSNAFFSTPHKVASINTHAAHFLFETLNGTRSSLCTDPSYDPVYCDPVGMDSNPTTLPGAVFYSIGCHSGLVVPPEDPRPLDLPELMARKQVVAYVGNTGYGWGLIHGIGLSEQLASLTTRKILTSPSISIGKAMSLAKRQYYAELTEYDGFDEKVLHEWTLYGIPNYVIAANGSGLSVQTTTEARESSEMRLNESGARSACVGTICMQQATPEATSAGLFILGLGFSFGPGTYQRVTTADGDYFELNGISSGSAGTTIQPRFIYDSYTTFGEARGVIFDAGSYTPNTPFDPVVTVPQSSESNNQGEGSIPVRQTIRPQMRTSASNTACGPPRLTNLIVETGYYDNAGTEYIFDSTHFNLYYSGSADRVGPEFTDPGSRGFHLTTGSTANFAVGVNDPAGLLRVLVTYDKPSLRQWVSLDLTFDSASGTWKGSLPLTELIYYFVQAIDNDGNVTVWSQSYTDEYGTVHTAPVLYNAGPCTFSISPTTQHFPSSGGAGSLTVSAPMGCQWTSVSNAAWITVDSPAGNGDGVVSFTIAPNIDPLPRTGTITVAGLTFTVTQDQSCTYSIAPAEQKFPYTGGTGGTSVTAPLGCAWNAQSNQKWIAITAGANGTGNGSVTFSVAPNWGATQRKGSLVAAGQSFKVIQAACTTTISPLSQSFGYRGGAGSINVSAEPKCNWTATSNVSWVTIKSQTTGTGSGIVSYSVASNFTGKKRVGTVSVGGNTFTIVQTSVLVLEPDSADTGESQN